MNLIRSLTKWVVWKTVENCAFAEYTNFSNELNNDENQVTF